jgi:hypothetical protein
MTNQKKSVAGGKFIYEMSACETITIMDVNGQIKAIIQKNQPGYIIARTVYNNAPSI